VALGSWSSSLDALKLSDPELVGATSFDKSDNVSGVAVEGLDQGAWIDPKSSTDGMVGLAAEHFITSEFVRSRPTALEMEVDQLQE
jgi:hypothetical protein